MTIESKYNGELSIIRDGDCYIVAQGIKILCQGYREYPYFIHKPIQWDKYSACEEWCKTGTIGDLQEDLSCLAIGFVENFVSML